MKTKMAPEVPSKRQLLFFLWVLVISHSLCEAAKAGTTPHFKDIVLGKCWNYVRLYGDTISDPSARNCSKVWEVFSSAFLYKDPCKLNETDYDSYFDLVRSAGGLSKVLFWSGTKKAVHDYSDFNARYTTLEDTFGGFIVDDLNWCGSPSSPDGLDYQACPQCGYDTVYWAEASERFAKSAKGAVYVMLNGSRRDAQGNSIPAYSSSSFFGSKELPNLDPKVVVKLNIIVIHTPNEPKFNNEYCGKGSLKQLSEDGKKYGLKMITCQNDPPSALHVLCVDYPDASECTFLTNERETIEECETVLTILACALGVVAVMCLPVTCLYSSMCWKKRKIAKKRTQSILAIVDNAS